MTLLHEMMNQRNTYMDNIKTQYLDPRWQERRQMILQRDHWKCRNCGSKDQLVVHHRQYHSDAATKTPRNVWEYSDCYLITLCDACHAEGHKLFKIPNYYL